MQKTKPKKAYLAKFKNSAHGDTLYTAGVSTEPKRNIKTLIRKIERDEKISLETHTILQFTISSDLEVSSIEKALEQVLKPHKLLYGRVYCDGYLKVKRYLESGDLSYLLFT